MYLNKTQHMAQHFQNILQHTEHVQTLQHKHYIIQAYTPQLLS